MNGVLFGLFVLMYAPTVIANYGYVGCFQHNLADVPFNRTPGDYDISRVTPLSCMHACSSEFRYSTLTADGALCFCLSDINLTSAVNDSQCHAYYTQSRDGYTLRHDDDAIYSSVYGIAQGVKGLVLNLPKVVGLLSPTWIKASVLKSDGVLFRFDINHDVVSEFSNTSSIPYVFQRQGEHSVRVTAKSETSTVTASVEQLVEVYDKFSDVEIQCPPTWLVGNEINCQGVWNRGDVALDFDFGDGSYRHVSFNTPMYMVGPAINQSQEIVQKDDIVPRTFVLTSAVVPEDGEIFHWELLASKPGKVRVQVFRPFCDPTYPACYNRTTSLESPEPVTCDQDGCICLPSKQCILTSKAHLLSNNCSNTHNDIAVLETDYRLVSQLILNIATIGYHLFTVPDIQPVTVSAGDVIGWSSDGGDLAHTPEWHLVFEYPEIGPPGSELLRDTFSVATSYALAAYVRQPIPFEMSHTYTEPGLYLITTSLSNSTSAVVRVDYPVTPFNLPLPRILTANSTIFLRLGKHNGSSLYYAWDFGDGTGSNTTIPVVTHVYRYPGLYTITLVATNAVSNFTLTSTHELLEPIKDCHFKQSITAVVLGKPTFIEWECKSGSNISFSVSFGDNSTEILHSCSKGNTGCNVTYLYTAAGNFSVEITASSPVGPNSTFSRQNFVEIPIRRFQVRLLSPGPSSSSFLYVNTHSLISVETFNLNGTHASCVFDFGNSRVTASTPRMTASTPRAIHHTYHTPGVYHVNVTCSNRVSSAWVLLNTTINVEEIEPLNVSLQVWPAVYGTHSLFTFNIIHGNLFKCVWNYGDGNTINLTFPVEDKNFSHLYQDVGTYTVNVSCRNDIGYSSAVVLANVDEPIRSATIVRAPRYLRVGQSADFVLSWDRGTRVVACIDCDDDASGAVVNTSATMTTIHHDFTEPGKYQVVVRLWNSVSTVGIQVEAIIVQYPVTGVQVFAVTPSRCPTHSIAFCLNLTRDSPYPSNASATFNFPDGTQTLLPNIDLTKPFCLQRQDYGLFPGDYDVTVNVTNHVSSRLLEASAHVNESQLKGIRVLSNNSSVFLGAGNLEYFALGTPVGFTVPPERNDVGFEWQIGTSLSIPTVHSSLEHTFDMPGCFDVSVSIQNSRLSENCVSEICVQERIKAIELDVQWPTYFKDETVFSFSVKERDVISCFLLNFGDNTSTSFGDPACGFSLRNLTSSTHLYKTRGNYIAQLTAWNNVSTVRRSVQVGVWDEACPPPKIHLSGGGPERSPLVVKRNSKEIVLQPLIRQKCVVAHALILKWQLSIVVENGGNLREFRIFWREISISGNSSQRLDNMDFVMLIDDLPTETFVVELCVGFNGIDRDLDDVVACNYTWFTVSRSQLVARIKGGISLSAPYNTTLVLDGRQSYDPDGIFDLDSLTLSWTCRPLNSSNFLKTSSNHCFKNHSTFFSNATDVVSFSTGDLVRPQVYIFGLEVKEGRRRSTFEQTVVVVDDPIPRLDIRCVLNCEETVDPSQRLVLQSQCLNYETSTRLFYEWSVYACSATNGTAGSSCHVIPNFGDKTSTGLHVPNLATLPDVLEIGTQYHVRCSAWRPGREYAVGYVEYLLVVNSPPSGGSCVVEPSIGEAMVTTFYVRCMNWFDEDQPLTYSVEIQTSEGALLVSFGNHANMSMFLPEGKAENNFTIGLVAKVLDSMLFSTSTVHFVQVFEPRSLVYSQVITDLKETFDEKENLNVGFGVVISLCSVLNNELNVLKWNVSDAHEARGKIARMLSKVNASTFDEVRGLATSLEGLSAKSGEVDSATQNEITRNIQNNMAAIHSLSQASRDMIGIGTSIHTVLSNIIEAALFQSVVFTMDETKHYNNNTSNDTIPASQVKESEVETIENALETIDEINNVMLGQVVADDRPTVIATDNFNVHVTRIRLEDLSRDNHVTNALPVKFNDVSSFLENNNLTELSVLGCLITNLTKNLGVFNSSDELNSNILRVNMKDSEGPAVDLAMMDMEVITKTHLADNLNISQILILNSRSTLKTHTFNRTVENTGLVLQLQPVNSNLRLRAFLSLGQHPTPKKYDFRADFPLKNLTSGVSPYAWVLSHDQLRNFSSPYFQQYFLGLEILDKPAVVNYTFRVSWAKCLMLENEQGDWNSDRCKIGPKTTLIQTHCMCRPAHMEGGDQYVSRTRRSARGSRPSWKSGIFKISIGAGVFPAPNKIDFKHVFDEDITDNPLALIAILSIFGVFLLFLIYARRQDQKDIEKFGVATLPDNNPSDKHFYEITVYTGSGLSAGTTADVSVLIKGQENTIEPRVLFHPKRKCFQRDSVDTFLLSSADRIGKIHYIQIWHNNGGTSPAWFLSKIIIRDLNEGATYSFLSESWLAVEKGGGNVQTILFPASEQDMTRFWLLFNTSSQRSLKDRHLWFSVFTRPVDSRFTRVQRLSCCLTLLYSTMLVNAMFYGKRNYNKVESTVTIGPFRFGLNELGIGLISATIILPFNALIVWVFRNIEAKPCEEDVQVMKASSKFWWFYQLFFCCFKDKNSGPGLLGILTRITTEYFHKNDENEDVELNDVLHKGPECPIDMVGEGDIDFAIPAERPRPQKTKKVKKLKYKSVKLPYCYLYIAWFSLSLVCVTCAFFVVLYGLQFGKDVSARWLASMTISFFQDVLISEPLKVFAIATVVALIIKKPQNLNREEHDQENEFVDYQQWIDHNNSKEDIKLSANVKPPDEPELKKARRKRLQEIKMSSLLKEILLYMLFVVCLSAVTYKNKNPLSFKLNKVMSDIFIQRADNKGKSFSQIIDVNGIFTWMNNTLLHGIYSSSSWYNQQVNRQGSGTIAHGNLYLIGKARVRQTRVKENSCAVPKYLHDIIHKCHGSYSKTNKDIKCYGLGWTPVVNRSLCDPKSSLDPWKYMPSLDDESSKLMTGRGEGFMFDLSRANQAESVELLASLLANNWLDERTRDISIEINVYNAPLNLFCLGNLLIRQHPSNGITKTSSFTVTKLFALNGILDSYAVISHLFIFIFFLILTYRQAKLIYRLGCKYFRSFWNCLQCLIVLLTLVCVALFFVRFHKIEQLLTSLEEHRDVTSFSHVASIDTVFGHMIAVVVFLSWLGVIKLLRFNRRLMFLQETLRRIVSPLKAFSVVFLTLFLAFWHSGYLIFSRNLKTFRDMPTSFVSLSSLFMGHLDFTTVDSSNRVLGPIFLFTVMFFGGFIFVNLFVALILESFMVARLEAKTKENEYELMDFVFSQLRLWVGFAGTKSPARNVLSPKLGPTQARGQKPCGLHTIEDETSTTTSDDGAAIDSLDGTLDAVLQEDWAEEVALYELFVRVLGRDDRFDGFPDMATNDEVSEFWKELGKNSDYFREIGIRDASSNNIELSFSTGVLGSEDDHL